MRFTERLRNLTINGNAANVSALGNQGSGGIVKLASGFVQESNVCCPGGQFVQTIVTQGNSTLDVSGTIDTNGKGTGNGGTIWIAGPNIQTGSQVALQANGRNGGVIKIESSGANGINIQHGASVQTNAVSGGQTGSITVQASLGTVEIGNGNDQVVFASNVGAGASAIGKGGTVTLSAGRDLRIHSNTSVNVAGGALNGDGGTVSMTAGTAGEGVITIDGEINANGGATRGTGGDIKLTHNSVNGMTINGSLLADSGTTGNSGHIDFAGTNSGELRVDINGTVTAYSVNGLNTSVKAVKLPFDSPQSGIWIHVSPEGKLQGHVDLTSGYIKLDAGNGNVLINQLAAQQGSIEINATGPESRVSILAGKTVQAKDRITIRTTELRNDGILKTLATGSKIEVISEHDLKFGGVGTVQLPDDSAFSLTSNLGTVRVENSPTISGTSTSSVSFNALSLEPNDGNKCAGCVHFGIDLNLKVSAGTFNVSAKDIGFNQNAKITSLLGGTKVAFSAPQDTVDLNVHNVDNGTQAFLTINQSAQKNSSFEMSGKSIQMKVDGLTIDTSTAVADAKGGDITLKAIDGQLSIGPATSGNRALTLVTRSNDSVGGQVSIESKTNLSLDSIKIQTNSNGTGNGGNVSIKSTGASGVLSITGTTTEIQTEGGITKSENKTSSGGTITVTAPHATLIEGLFSSDGGYRGNGGKVSIAIESGELELGSSGNFAVSANSGVSGGDAANIELSAGSIKANSLSLHADALWVDDSGNRSGTGHAGQITVTAKDGDITVNERNFSLIADGGNGQIQVHADKGSITALAGSAPIRFKTGGRDDNSTASSLLLSSGQDIDLGLVEINANGDQYFANGGLVDISSPNKVSMYGEINAKGGNAGQFNGGNGGIISINTGTLDFGRGSISEQLTIDVTGVAAPSDSQILRSSGAVSVTASNDSRELSIHTSTTPASDERAIKISGLAFTGAGGRLEVSTKGNITIADILQLQGLPFAPGGNLKLTTTARIILPSLVQVNGHAGSVTLSSNNIEYAPGGTKIEAIGSTLGNAGNVTISTSGQDIRIASDALSIAAQPNVANANGNGGHISLTARDHAIVVAAPLDVSGGANDINVGARIDLRASTVRVESAGLLLAPQITVLTTSTDTNLPSVSVSGEISSSASNGHVVFQNSSNLWIAMNDGKVNAQGVGLTDLVSAGFVRVANVAQDPNAADSAATGYWANVNEAIGSKSFRMNLQLKNQSELLLGNIKPTDSFSIVADKVVTIAAGGTISSDNVRFDVPVLHVAGRLSGRDITIVADQVRISNEATSQGSFVLSPRANSLNIFGDGSIHAFTNTNPNGEVRISASAVLHLQDVQFFAAHGLIVDDATLMSIGGTVEATSATIQSGALSLPFNATLRSTGTLDITTTTVLNNSGRIISTGTSPVPLSITSPNIINTITGEIISAGRLDLRNNGDLLLQGNPGVSSNFGTLKGTSVHLISQTGSVTATTGTLDGLLEGQSAGDFRFTATSSYYDVGKITAGTFDNNQDQRIHLRMFGTQRITLTGNLDPGFITLETLPGSSGTIVLATNLVASNTVTINLQGTSSLEQLPGFSIYAPHTVLSSESGSIGSELAPVMINSGTLSASSQDGGAVHVASSGALELTTIESSSTLTFSSAAPLLVSGAISAPSIQLSTSLGSSAGIIVTGSLNATGLISLHADGQGTVDTQAGMLLLGPDGSLSASGNTVTTGPITGGKLIVIDAVQGATISGPISAPSAQLSIQLSAADSVVAIAKDITVSDGNFAAARVTNDGVLSANTLSFGYSQGLTLNGAGSLNAPSISAVSSAGAVSLTQQQITGAITGAAFNGYSVETRNGELLVSNLQSQSGDIRLLAGGGRLAVSAAGSLISSNGSIFLQNNDLSADIVIGTGATLKAFSTVAGVSPQIFIGFGDAPTSPVVGQVSAAIKKRVISAEKSAVHS